MIFIGIDPGVSGGIALIDERGHVDRVLPMPATERDVLDVFEGYLADDNTLVRDAARAVLERVNPGVFGAGKSGRMGVVSAFKFGGSYFGLRMALTSVEIPFEEVAPVRWQTALGCRTGGDKNITKRRAQQLFPRVTVTHAIADALLLAEFCRRRERAYGKAQKAIEGGWRGRAPRRADPHPRPTQGPGAARHAQPEGPGAPEAGGPGRG